MKFTKMQGAGNDYVYVDCFTEPIPPDPASLARRVSDRHFGIGADGLILICPAEGADAEMRMYNADGSSSEMCGNGIRCVAKYVYDHGLCRRDVLKIVSGGRMLSLELEVSDQKVAQVRVDMGEPTLLPADIPTTLAPREGTARAVCDVPLKIAGGDVRVTAVSMGNPHCVLFVEELTDDLVLGRGPVIEHDHHFPNRVNVEFVKVVTPTRLKQRTWERGSGETMACGTGASAVCVAGVLTARSERKVSIELLGGELQLEWRETDNHVYMTGPAEEVFTGDWPE